jgi:hypothetical protein
MSRKRQSWRCTTWAGTDDIEAGFRLVAVDAVEAGRGSSNLEVSA